MKRAGEVLSALFDERLVKKAKGYSRLLAYWETAVSKSGIAAAAAHSRVRQVERGILRVEADHPGWIQILQTKEHFILENFSRAFPDMGISGISIMLGRGGPDVLPETTEAAETVEAGAAEVAANETEAQAETETGGYDAITDEGLKSALKRLEKTIVK